MKRVARTRLQAVLVGALLAAAGCGDNLKPGGSGIPSPGRDGGPPVTRDAGVQGDAGTAAQAHPAREVVSGSGRVSGGGMVMDVQIGHPLGQDKTTAGDKSAEGNAAVKP
jgi:hypothetical protein